VANGEVLEPCICASVVVGEVLEPCRSVADGADRGPADVSLLSWRVENNQRHGRTRGTIITC
jgi:hypothetical protein